MTAGTWPAWLAWLLIIAILLTLILVWSLCWQVSALRGALQRAGMGQSGGAIRSRKELEDAYTAGAISRDAYERMKGRL
jgi:uncharacterized membrane protein